MTSEDGLLRNWKIIIITRRMTAMDTNTSNAISILHLRIVFLRIMIAHIKSVISYSKTEGILFL